MHLVQSLTQKVRKASFYSLSAILALSALLVVFYNNANAAQLTQALVRFDHMKISTGTTGTVCAKPATTATEASVQVTFPTGYTLGAVGAFTVSTTNLAWPGSASAWPGIGTATNVTAQTVTFPSTDLTVGTLYCFNWTNTAAVQIKSSASASNSGTITTRDSVPATIDTATFSTASIADDQIAVSASVSQAFSFALSGNSDALGALSTGSVATSPTPRTVTVNTNSANGWSVWAKDANTGLTSTASGYTISSIATGAGNNLTLSAGSEGYNFGVTSSQTGGSGSISVPGGFNGSSAGQGGVLDTSLRTIASSTGTANNAVLTLKNNAAISATTAAATDYADTITVVGAGLF